MCSGHHCECGCGNITNIYRGKPRKFMKNHYKNHTGFGLWWKEGKPHTTKGKKRPDASTRMMLNNPNWSGDDVGREALHDWVRRRLIKPDKCEKCGLVPPYDLANVTGIYSRDLNNWKYWCRRCHMTDDGRMGTLKIFAKMGADKRWGQKVRY